MVIKKTIKKSTKKVSAKKAYNSAAKAHFRESEKWRNFRKAILERDKKDFITGSKLQPKANIHHLDMSTDNYENLDNPDNFIALNPRSHKMLHFLYTIYKKDPEVLDRIKYLLDRMVELN